MLITCVIMHRRESISKVSIKSEKAEHLSCSKKKSVCAIKKKKKKVHVCVLCDAKAVQKIKVIMFSCVMQRQFGRWKLS